MTERIGIAFSGGADSTAAVLLLRARGYNLFALHMLLSDAPAAREQAVRAASLARQLGLECAIIDMIKVFSQQVVAPFCAAYEAGRTPNPCIVCNRELKFGLLFQEARARGADRLATGHYARIAHHGDTTVLKQAIDAGADQSYFLYAIDPSVLGRLLLPLGDVCRAEIRNMVLEHGLPLKGSSQDICFLAGQDVQSFLSTHVPALPGDVVDTHGRVLGRHGGLPFYTVGQRHGLGLALRQPMYVTRLDVRLNRVVLGTASELLCTTARLQQVCWLTAPGQSSFAAQGRIRHRSQPAPVQVTLRGDGATIRFITPQSAVAPGQSIVLYDADTVLGGGVIADSVSEEGDAS